MQITAAVSRGNQPAPVLETLELEAPRAGEMLVRMAAVGICHTDLHEHPGRHAPHPIVLGHEGAGVVEALGEGVRGFAVGDHVLLSGSSCGVCPSCVAGRPTYCDLAMPMNFGGKRLDGSTALACGDERIHSHFFGQSSFATHSIVPERTAVKVDKDIPLELLAPLGCGVITGAGSVIEALKVGAGDTIAIFGVGGVGLSAVMAAKLVGAKRIVAVDINPGRLELARELGATDAIRSDGEDVAKQIRAVTGRGVDFTFNTTTVPAVHTMALECLAMNGTAGFVAAPRGEWAPAMFPMLAGGKQLRGILGGDANPRTFLPMLIDYWRQGRFPFDRLIETYAFDEIGKAFHDCEAGTVIKPVLKVGDAA
ncbi:MULTISPECIES: NAD(P)-dependent alcohol dehydrogenase [unclassified Sphingobium]|uniref:NAD(P)-dependent alcohol dehydrogenase n=1 Tax=unclassified Sphingobium TaxID=2611147 RepID=UPI0022258739|nr:MULTISPECIES: NAD(P)-dependent alcohol dehydrogenase [unclassified Sphingobium]MCW2412563.1 aryl-alcohol dehydrogenase [Sphingobium sp. B8D3D]MCW2415140.1 aryl-alcohol dehydrogenase [Sphingobium sp. B8D3A]